MFYANYNKYGSETDVGFQNTNEALAFDSKRERDDYVAEHIDSNQSVRPLSAAQARKMTKPYDGYRAYRMPNDACGLVRMPA